MKVIRNKIKKVIVVESYNSHTNDIYMQTHTDEVPQACSHSERKLM